MNRTRAWWHRRKPRIRRADELAQCLANGIDYEPEGEEWKTYPASNDNCDTLAVLRETGRVPHLGKAKNEAMP